MIENNEMKSKNMTRKERISEAARKREEQKRLSKKIFVDSIRHEFESLENDICMALGLDIKLFKSKCHIRAYSDARAMLFAIMRPLTIDFIGFKLLGSLHREGYNHASLINCLDKHEYLVKNDQKYKQMFELIR